MRSKNSLRSCLPVDKKIKENLFSFLHVNNISPAQTLAGVKIVILRLQIAGEQHRSFYVSRESIFVFVMTCSYSLVLNYVIIRHPVNYHYWAACGNLKRDAYILFSQKMKNASLLLYIVTLSCMQKERNVQKK